MKEEETVTIIIPKIIIWPAVLLVGLTMLLTFISGIAHAVGW